MAEVASPSPVPTLNEPSSSSSAPAALAQDGSGGVQVTANGHGHGHDHSHGAMQQSAMASTKAAESLPNIGEMEAKCGGCKGIIDQEGGGVVVAFG